MNIIAATKEVIVPPMLYLPTLEHPDGGSYAVIRTMLDGRKGLLAYTALDRLADSCGSNQPWALVPTVDLGDIRRDQPFDVVAFDLDIPRTMLADGRLRA